MAILLVLMAAVDSINVLNILHDSERLHQPLAWWKPAVWEGSSGLVLILLAWIPMAMATRFPPQGRRWLQHIVIHLAATIPFSLLHVGLMILLRKLAYAFAGADYRFAGGAGELLFEYRKDVFAYVVFAGIFWAVRRFRQTDDPPLAPASPPLFEIDEGQRLIRVPPTDILCARSAGNYVEFFLADGRRPLMRTTLTGVEALLAPAGFVRTHRSWLVNRAHVVEAVAEGSGDYGLQLTGGVHVPLSRRYPTALESMRLNRSS